MAIKYGRPIEARLAPVAPEARAKALEHVFAAALHGAAAGAVYFLWELRPGGRDAAGRALAGAGAAGVLALLLSAPQLLPLLETIPHSAEYRARRAALDRAEPT